MIGTGSLSFDLVKSLTDRLPVMLCPRWLTTPTQPIAVDDVLAYLVAAKDLPPGESQVFEIGAEDVTTYGDMIRACARETGGPARSREQARFVPRGGKRNDEHRCAAPATHPHDER